MKTWQYYYRVNECKAKNADQNDCICWCDEGTGLFPDERHDNYSIVSNWRIKPDNNLANYENKAGNNMITKQQAELWQKWADVNRMCVDTGVDPKTCVKYIDGLWGEKRKWNPGFNDEPRNYQFAIEIVENRPVFNGDILWHKDGYKLKINSSLNLDFTNLSWNPPKETITISGKEFPAPDGDKTGKEFSYQLNISRQGGYHVFLWKKMQDRDAVEAEIIKALSGKCD